MRIKANGIDINYALTGKKEGPVVVLSHSLASSLRMWEPQMNALEPFFRVLRYDTRGHGDTEAPAGPYAVSLLAEDVIGLLDALEIDRVHFVGLSMGGMIGQCLALDHPRRLASLVLCDTAAKTPDENQPLWQERIDTARSKGLAVLVDQTMERWFTPGFLRQNPPMLSVIRNEILNTPPEGYIGCSEAIRRLNYLERLPEIRHSTLIIVGEDDPGTPVSASRAMHERISGSTLVILPSARHLTNVEQAQAFNVALIDFLGALARN